MTRPANMRAAMPKVAAWIDNLRAAFGAEDINAAMRFRVAGQPTFYATEAGHSVGVPLPAVRREVSAADMVINRPDPKAKP